MNYNLHASHETIRGLTFSNRASQRIFTKIKASGKELDVIRRIESHAKAVEGYRNNISSEDQFEISSFVALELYLFSQLETLSSNLLRAARSAWRANPCQLHACEDRINRTIARASREIRTDGLSNLTVIPIPIEASYFQSLSLQLEVVGGSLLMLYIILRPSELLRDSFLDISRNHLDDAITFYRRSFFLRRHNYRIEPGDNRKRRLVSEIDNETFAEVQGIVKKMLGPGVCLDIFGGVPIIQNFVYKENPSTASSSGSSAFFTILSDSGVGVKYDSYCSKEGDLLVEHRPSSSASLRSLCKFVRVNDRFAFVDKEILPVFAAKQILGQELYRLHIIHRKYVGLLTRSRRRGSDLIAKRLEIYRLSAIHGIISETIDKKRKSPILRKSYQLLRDLSLNSDARPDRDYLSMSKRDISDISGRLSDIFVLLSDTSGAVRDESNLQFQKSVGCLAIFISVLSIAVALILVPLVQIRIERTVARCFPEKALFDKPKDRDTLAKITSPSCWFLQFLK